MKASETAIHTAYDDHVQFDPAEPERNLLRAVLRTAMEDIHRRGEAYRDARRFFLSNDDTYLYSFHNICYQLGICPKTLRRMLGVLPERNAERERPEGSRLAA